MGDKMSDYVNIFGETPRVPRPIENRTMRCSDNCMPEDKNNVGAHHMSGEIIADVWTMKFPCGDLGTDVPGKPNVLFMPKTGGGVGHYRMWVPAKCLARAGFCNVRVASAATPEDVNWAHICVMNRCDSEPELRMLRKMKEIGKLVVYDIDDCFDNLPADNPAKIELENRVGSRKRMFKFNEEDPDEMPIEIAGYRGLVRACIGECDMLTVSTNELAEMYGRYAPKVKVLCNAIDSYNSIWHRTRKPDPHGIVTIGYAGSATHTADLMECKHAIEHVVRLFDNVEFAVCGPIEWMDMFDIPAERKRWIHPKGIEEYPDVFMEFDVSLAPLAPSTFNKYKSALKAKEAGVLGIPTLASAYGPYVRFAEYGKRVSGGEDVCMLAHSPSDWNRKLEKLIVDTEYRLALGKAAQEFACTCFDARTSAKLRWQAYRELIPWYDEPSGNPGELPSIKRKKLLDRILRR